MDCQGYRGVSESASFPKRVTRADVEYAAVNGMLDTLDPHSVLLNPATYAEMRWVPGGNSVAWESVVSAQGRAGRAHRIARNSCGAGRSSKQDSITRLKMNPP